MKKIAVCAGLTLTAFAGIASATEFYLTSRTARSLIVFDKASAKRSGDVVQVDGYVLVYPPSAVRGGNIWWTKGQEEYDCAGHRSRQRRTSNHDVDGRLLSRVSNSQFAPWQATPPGSALARVEAALCNGEMSPELRPVPSLEGEVQEFLKTAPPLK